MTSKREFVLNGLGLSEQRLSKAGEPWRQYWERQIAFWIAARNEARCWQ